jgi:F-type H+-transporting ATPase subunit gamma
MAQSLHKTKRRIASVNSTKKITKAMELVATVKLKRFKNVMLENEAYANELVNIIHHLFEHIEVEDNPYLVESKSKTSLYIVVSSNLGLCASYNNNIYNFVSHNVSKENTVVIPIGFKGQNFLKKEGYELIENYVDINERLSFSDIRKLGEYITREFISGKYQSIKLIYTRYVNSLKFVPEEMTIFPIQKVDAKNAVGYEPIFDPDAKTLIDELIPIYVVSTLYHKIIESQVSEQASRRTAMENANDNADEIIDKLTLEYNKARQTAITQEINEIVSGSINK